MSDITSENHNDQDINIFEKQSAEKQPSLPGELFDFLLNNKKWWLAPILITLLLLGILIIIGGSGAAPFIYTLF